MATNQVEGTLRKVKDDVYEARIMGGWYVGFGKTPKDAKKKVITAYEREHNVSLKENG